MKLRAKLKMLNKILCDSTERKNGKSRKSLKNSSQRNVNIFLQSNQQHIIPLYKKNVEIKRKLVLYKRSKTKNLIFQGLKCSK